MGSAQVKPIKPSNFYNNSSKPSTEIVDRGCETKTPQLGSVVTGGDRTQDVEEELVSINDGEETDEETDTDNEEETISHVSNGNDVINFYNSFYETLEEFQDAFIANLNLKICAVQSRDSCKQDDGSYTSEVVAVVGTMCDSYGALNDIKNVSLTDVNLWRRRVTKIAMETNTLDLMCDIVKETYSQRLLDEKKSALLYYSLLTLCNLSDASSEFAIAVANYPGLCEIIKEIMLDMVDNHVNGEQTVFASRMTDFTTMLIHNLSMPESNIGRLRAVDFLPILVTYLKSPKAQIRLSVFVTMAAIINEEESEVIKANKEQVTFLLEYLLEASNTDLHRFKGWSCEECTLSIRFLARNDANKKLLVELGALELLVKMGNIGNHDEQFEAVSALWALSFDSDNKKKICNEEQLGVVDLFVHLKHSEDERIRKVCKRALWTIRDELKSSRVDKYKKLEKTAWPSVQKVLQGKKQVKDADHVMISYQWDDKKTLIKIRDEMKAAGIKVWMDIDQMGGSTIEAMADAVEGAKLVLMCMSQKYKNSQNCRLEAEYAFKTKKMIIPLKMEYSYKADGWLGILAGTKLFFEFSGKYKFEDKMKDLLKEIARIYNKPMEDFVDRVKSVLGHADPCLTQPLMHGDPNLTHTLNTIKDWKPEDVKRWITKHDLKSCNMSKVNGGDVAMLLMMYNRAPESFFKCVRDTLKLKNLRSMSALVWAISELTEMH